MSFEAEVLRVLIASPSDVSQERDEIEEAIFKWNTVYAEDKKVVLLPARWENVAPAYRGEDPQQIINEQLVNKCDILIGVFWKKLGTATVGYPSGTLEEIDNFIQQGKEVMLYFVDKPVSMDEDFNEIQGVQQYKSEYQVKGIYYKYDITKIVEHLYRKISDYVVKKSEGNTNILIRGSVQPNQPEEPSEITKNEELLSLESIILSGVLTDGELMLLNFIIDTEERSFGYRWKAEETLSKIREWEEEKSIREQLTRYYDSAVRNLAERGILEENEYTSAGNPRLYVMPIAKYDQLRNLSEEVKYIIEKVAFKKYIPQPH